MCVRTLSKKSSTVFLLFVPAILFYLLTISGKDNGANCAMPTSARKSLANEKKKKKKLLEANKIIRARILREGRANFASMETRIDINAISENKNQKEFSRANFARRIRSWNSRLWNYTQH